MAEVNNITPSLVQIGLRNRDGQPETLREGQISNARADARDDGLRNDRLSRGVRADRFREDQQVQRADTVVERLQADSQQGFNRIVDNEATQNRADVELNNTQQTIQDEGVRRGDVDRQQRLEDRQLQQQVFATQQRLDEELARQRIEQAAFNPELPRGSIVDITA